MSGMMTSDIFKSGYVDLMSRTARMALSRNMSPECPSVSFKFFEASLRMSSLSPALAGGAVIHAISMAARKSPMRMRFMVASPMWVCEF